MRPLLSFSALLIWAVMALPLQADTLRHLGTFFWPTPTFVGLSGLEVSDDGLTFHAVSDRGWFLSGTFARDDTAITGVTLQSYLPILGQDGWPVAGRRVGDQSDAEGLAVAPDGSLWISFERWARVARYQTPTSPAEWIKDHPDFDGYRDNRQLEALALSPDGRLFTFAEVPQGKDFPIYRLDGTTWVIAGQIARQNRFSIVGADFGPDGRLYLLERKLVMGLWWQSRVRRMDVENPDIDETLWTSRRGEFNNVEGIAVWHDNSGTRITIVSDDNGDADEPTQFIEFRLEQTLD